MRKQTLQTVFWILVGIFIVIFSYFAIPFAHKIKRALFPYMAVIAFTFFLLGGLLTYYTIKLKIEGKLKWFLILTGICPMIFLISVLLHNFVYGLFIYLFGENFWNGGDEPFFFILAHIVCPIAFLTGIIGSIIIMLKKNNS